MIEGHLLPMLYVSDVRRSVEFYHSLLGFDFEGWWDPSKGSYSEALPEGSIPDFAELRAGDLVLHLHLQRGEEEVHAGDLTLHLRVSDVDAYHQEVTSRGVEFSPPSDTPWGWRMFHIEDPDGFSWSFYQEL